MSDIDLNKIGNILKTRRLEKNLSIRDLSARSDTAASTISQSSHAESPVQRSGCPGSFTVHG